MNFNEQLEQLDKGKNEKDEKKKEKKPKSKSRTRRAKLAMSAFVFVLAAGALGNWYWENSEISSKVTPVISSQEKTKTLGEATYVGATTQAQNNNEYFSKAKLERQNARDEALEKLQKIVDSSQTESAAAKTAADKIAVISNSISAENKIETLIKAKGYNNVLAIISTDGKKVEVIVDAEKLSEKSIVQIKTIAMEQSGCSFDKVSIIQPK